MHHLRLFSLQCNGTEWWFIWLGLDTLSEGWEVASDYLGWPIASFTSAFCHWKYLKFVVF